eukprot:scaffold1471_cov413-Prasinococcus_capsulatus_cf.AAC.11
MTQHGCHCRSQIADIQERLYDDDDYSELKLPQGRSECDASTWGANMGRKTPKHTGTDAHGGRPRQGEGSTDDKNDAGSSASSESKAKARCVQTEASHGAASKHRRQPSGLARGFL